MSFPNSNKSSSMARPLESTPSAEQRVIVLDSQVNLGESSLPPSSVSSSSSSSSSSTSMPTSSELGKRQRPLTQSLFDGPTATTLERVRELLRKDLVLPLLGSNLLAFLAIDNTSGGYPWGAGGIAQLLEAAYRALDANLLRYFLELNAHIFTPEVFLEIMGQKGTAKQIKDGLYWLSSPSLEAVKVINALEDKSRSLIVGACNGIWFDGIRKGVSVDKYDLFPRGGGVHFHRCNGSPFFGVWDCIIFPCSLPSPHHQRYILRAAIAAVNEGGEVIVVDIATRDEPTMDACVKVFQWYQRNGNGEVHDEIVVTEEDLHNVRKITFVRGNISVSSSYFPDPADNFPLAPQPIRKTAKAMMGINHGENETGLHPLVNPPINTTHFMELPFYTNTNGLRVAGVYGLGGEVKEDVYFGSSIDVCNRLNQHLSGKGNKMIHESVKRFNTPEEKLAATRQVFLLSMCEIPQWMWDLFQPSIDMRGFDFLLRLFETKAINHAFRLAKEDSSGLNVINSHSNGFAQGVQANASANGRRALELGVGAASFTSRASALAKERKIPYPEAMEIIAPGTKMNASAASLAFYASALADERNILYPEAMEIIAPGTRMNENASSLSIFASALADERKISYPDALEIIAPGTRMNEGASAVSSRAFGEKLAIVGSTHIVSIYFPGTPTQSLSPQEAFKTFQAISAKLADRFSDSFNLLTNGGPTTRVFQGYQISLVLKPQPIPSSTSSADGSTASSPLAAVSQTTTSSRGAGLITTFFNSAQATPSSNSEDFHQTLPTLSCSPVVYQAWTKGWHKLQPHLGSPAAIPPTHGDGGLLTGVQGKRATLKEIGEKMRAQFDAVTPIWRTKHNGEKGFVFGFYKTGSDAPPVIVADKSFNAEFGRTGYSHSVRFLKKVLKRESKRETPITCTDNGYVIFTSWEI
jgi:hypothetical protein